MRDNLFCILLPLILWAMVPSIAGAAEIYVPGDYARIQEAIDAAIDGDTILVGDGNWNNDHTSPLNLRGKAITLRSESGNPGLCVIDGGNWSKGIVCLNGETPETVISGFTFSRCVAYWQTSPSSSGPGDGACVYCVGSSPTIEHCRFVAGNAVWSNYGSSTEGNGGGIACYDGSCPTISGCEFIDCRAAEMGGAIYVEGGTASIFDCSFVSNLVLEGDGGAIAFEMSGGTIGRCSFSGNRALRGGAVMCIESAPVIGGSADLSNAFANNLSGAGADLCALRYSSVINAGFNTFDGMMLSDYWITPQGAFDLTSSQDTLEPIRTDVYVSPEGNDMNDGLSMSTPFRTIQYAMSRILPDASNLLTLHLSAGTYSPETNGEVFPLPLISYLTVCGSGQTQTVLSPAHSAAGLIGLSETDARVMNLTICDAEGRRGGGISAEDGELEVCDVTIRNSSAAAGAGMYLKAVSSRLTRVRIAGNYAGYNQGSTGIYSTGGSLNLVDSVVSHNSAQMGGSGVSINGNACLVNCTINSNFTQSGGAGVDVMDGDLHMVNCRFFDNTGPSCIWINSIEGHSTFELINCLLTDNGHNDVLFGINSTGAIRHCTFTGNHIGYSTLSLRAVSLTAWDSIFWNDCRSEFDRDQDSDVTVSYCDVRGGYLGVLNIDSDPNFTGGALSDYYLDDGQTGGTVSPCINAGSAATEDCVYSGDWGELDLSLRTAVSGWTADSDQVDIGYHWDHPACTGVKLDLSQDFFEPGDMFRLDAVLLNNSGSDWTECCLFVILDVYGSYWFAPSWIAGTEGFDCYFVDLQTGSHDVLQVIPEFEWPEVTDSASGLILYGAVTDPEITGILGDLDMVVFGYRE